MKKTIVVFITIFNIFLPALFLGCESSNIAFPVLGETKVFMQNMHKEYYNLGNAYFEMERFSDAIKYYKKASEDKSLKNSCDYKIAQCYAMSKDWGKALALYIELLEKDKDNLTIKTNIAYIYTMQGDYKNALSLYEDLLKIQPDNLSYKENYLAIILGSLDNFKENQKKFEEGFESLKTEYPKNKNIESFQKRYDEYLKAIEDEKNKDSENNKESEKSDTNDNVDSEDKEDKIKDSRENDNFEESKETDNLEANDSSKESTNTEDKDSLELKNENGKTKE